MLWPAKALFLSWGRQREYGDRCRRWHAVCSNQWLADIPQPVNSAHSLELSRTSTSVSMLIIQELCSLRNIPIVLKDRLSCWNVRTSCHQWNDRGPWTCQPLTIQECPTSSTRFVRSWRRQGYGLSSSANQPEACPWGLITDQTDIYMKKSNRYPIDLTRYLFHHRKYLFHTTRYLFGYIRYLNHRSRYLFHWI